MSAPLEFSDPRLRAIQRRAYENFCDRPEVRDWLLSQISDGTYLHFGPFGYFNNHLLLPVRVGADLCEDLVYWHCDVEPDTACFRRVVGIANVLGADAIRRALDFDSPLRVYRTPWRLLLASDEDEFVSINGAPGAVILNVGDLSYWARLARFAELHAEDHSHAVELASNIRASGAKPPPILFPDSGESRAAA